LFLKKLRFFTEFDNNHEFGFEEAAVIEEKNIYGNVTILIALRIK